MTADDRPVWKRCWCYRYGRCLSNDCPTACFTPPVPLTDQAWQQAYASVLTGEYVAAAPPTEEEAP
jgi:hypothetical protein